MSTFAISKFPTPIFDTPQIPFFGETLQKDDQGLLRNLETIAFPGTKLTLLKTLNNYAVQVSTQEYPSNTPLYVDRRFLEETAHEPLEREKQLPTAEKVLDYMKSLVGTRYFWGGNWAQGILQMKEMYPHFAQSEYQDDLLCKGVDCSGFLYQTTEGITPRNTSQLINYGKEIFVDLQSVSAVQEVVKPLDMLVWRGHVIMVLDSDQLIESYAGKGVIISPFKDRYSEILEKLQKENKTFYLRRWHPDIS